MAIYLSFLLSTISINDIFIYCFSRTPGSRQPSPAEEELSKNNGLTLEPGVVILKPQDQQLPPHISHLPPHLAPHLGVTLSEQVNSQFEHFPEQPPPVSYEQQAHPYAQPPPQPQQIDSAVLQQQQHNFDVQVGKYLIISIEKEHYFLFSKNLTLLFYIYLINLYFYLSVLSIYKFI